MAQDNTFGEVLKWGAIAVGAYLLWQYFTSSSASAAPAAAPASGGTPATPITLQSLIAAIEAAGTTAAATPPATGTVVAVPTTFAPVANETALASALIDTAGGVNSLNVDQWNYYAYQLGSTVLTPTQSAAVATAAGGDNPMSVDAYIAARTAAGVPLSITGIAGLGAAPLPVPLMFTYGAGGRPVLLIPGTGRAAA
jgi:hypothetical protein